MKHKHITLWRLTSHEFHRALKFLTPEIPKLELFKLLLEMRNRELAHFLRAIALLLVGVLFISNRSNSDSLVISLLTLTIKLPTSYAVFFLSFVFVAASVNIQNYFLLNEFMRRFLDKRIGFDNPTAFAIPFDGSSASTLGTQIQFRFFKSAWSHQLLSGSTFLLFLLPMFLVIAFIYCSLVVTAWQILLSQPSAPFGFVLSSATLPLLFFPLANIALQNVPFKFEKNHAYIRWTFLLHLHRREGLLPGQIESWINKRN